jgi:hypothetical protein
MIPPTRYADSSQDRRHASRPAAGATAQAPSATFTSGDAGVQRPLDSVTLWYRYWLFGWIFEDCNRGNLFENAAALARNRRKAGLLPVYIRRYTATGALSMSLSLLIGDAAPMWLQLLAVSPIVACVPLLVISLSVWVALRLPGA